MIFLLPVDLDHNPSLITARRWIASCAPAGSHQGLVGWISRPCSCSVLWTEAISGQVVSQTPAGLQRCQTWGEPSSKRPPSGFPGWPMSPCTAACSPAVTSSTSSWRRRSAWTGNTPGTLPSWQSVSMGTLITSGCAPWRDVSPGSPPGWFSANCCWTRALRHLWAPASSTQVRSFLGANLTYVTRRESFLHFLWHRRAAWPKDCQVTYR